MQSRHQELLAFKAADKSEIKKLKNEKKKLTKKLNYIPKSETKSEPIEANVDLNDNNVSAETETSMKDFNFTVPILNPFQVLENLEDVPYSEVIKDDSFKDLLKKEEETIREKVRISVRRKIEMKVEGMEVSDEDLELLEKELIEDLEEIVKEKLDIFRKNLKIQEEDFMDIYENEHFYWGGKDGDEMIYFDETDN